MTKTLPQIFEPSSQDRSPLDFFWGMHTVQAQTVETVWEYLDPLVKMAKSYMTETRNGALEALSRGAIGKEPRELVRAAVQDFVSYVADRLQTNLPPSLWRKDTP